MARRYNHPKRQVDRALIQRIEIERRLASEWSPVMDVMFTRLHEELAQWPDDWYVDPHGTGDNPHVWLRMDKCTCGELKAAFEARAAIVTMLNGLMNRDVQ